MHEGGMSANIERQEKHIQIENALNDLEKQILKIKNFTANLSEGPIPEDERMNVKAPTTKPNFLSVYSNIAERIQISTKEIAESINIIKDMLL